MSDFFEELYTEYSDALLEADIATTKMEILPQSLDSPILDMTIRKLNVLLSGRPDDKIRTGASFHRERVLLQDLQTAYLNRVPTAYNARFLVTILKSVSDGVWGTKIPKSSLDKKLYKPLMKRLDGQIGSISVIPEIVHSIETERYYKAYDVLRRAYNSVRSQSLSSEHPMYYNQLPNGDTLSIRKEGFCWAPSGTTQVFYGSMDMFMCIHDAIRLRYGAFLARDVTQPSVRSSKIMESFKWQEQCILSYGNEGYEILKNTESLAKASLSELDGGGFPTFSVIDNMVKKITDKELKLSQVPAGLAEKYKLILDDCSEAELVALFALQKCTGHPVVDPEVGGQKARLSGQEPDKSMLSKVLESSRRFKHELLASYLRKNQGWPPMIFEDSGTTLERLYRKQVTRVALGEYPSSDWDSAWIGKIVEFDYHYDITELLDDKSCAPRRALMEGFYNKSLQDRTFRRLLSMFVTQNVDIESLIHQFAKNELPDDYYNILVYPKEKEFKVAPRMFCMLTYWIRLILAIIQENIKKKVFPMFPQQSMTMSRNELTRSMLKMTAGGRPLFIEVDFSSWNLKFRDLLMCYYGRTLDKLFGVAGFFGKSNYVFSRSTITVFVNDYRVPKFEGIPGDSNMSWEKHEGGFEGIDQATWSLATIIMMCMAMDPYQLAWLIMMQGDNVTLTVTMPDEISETQEEALALEISKSIELTSAQLNHEAKPEEFVISKTLYTYGKQIMKCQREGDKAANGHLVENPLKYTYSVYPSTNDEIPSELDALGGLFSACAGAAQVTHQPLTLWRLALIWFEDTFHLFRTGGGWSGKTQTWKDYQEEDLVYLAIVPSVCGGLPIMTWNSFLSKHEPCPLVSALASLKYLRRAGVLEAGRVLGGLLDETLYDPNPEPERLLDDPYSLPLRQAPSHLTIIRKRVEEYISTVATNHDVRGLAGLRMSAQDKELKRALLGTSPFYPAVAADAYKLSVVGKAREVIGMFTLTRTFVSNAKEKTSIAGKIMDLMDSQNYYIQLRVAVYKRSISSSYPNRLSHDFAAELRRRWKLKNPIEGLESVHPLDYTVQVGGTKSVLSSGISAYCTEDVKNILTSCGRQRPFLGGKTRERRVGKGYEIRRSRGTDELSRLAVISTSGLMDPSALAIIKTIVESRVSVSLSKVQELFPTIIGGTVAHRYEQLGVDSRIGPAGTPNVLTHLRYNSDHVQGVSASSTDYPIAFQLFFTYLSSYFRIASGGSFVHNDARSMKILVSCSVMKPLDDSPIRGDDMIPTPRLSRLIGNRLVDIPFIEIVGQDAGWVPSTLAEPRMPITSEEKEDWVVALLLHEIEGVKVLDIDLDNPADDLLSSVPKIDAVEFDHCGGNMMISAAIRSVINCVLPEFMTRSGTPRSRPELFGLAERYSRIVAAMMLPHFWRYGANLGKLSKLPYADLGLLQHSTKAAARRLSQIISTEVVTTIFTTADPTAMLSRLIFRRARKVRYVRDMVRAFSLAMWILTRVDAVDTTIGDAKILCQFVKAELANCVAETDDLTEGIVTGITNRLMVLILNLPTPRLTALRPLVSFLMQLGAGTLFFASPLSTSEGWRITRTWEQQRSPVYNNRLLYCSRGFSPVGQASSPEKHKTLAWRIPAEIPVAADADVDLPTSIRSRMLKPYGIVSQSVTEWLSPLKGVSGPALVIGTGAGAVQSVLASFGVESRGIDLPDVLSDNALGNPYARIGETLSHTAVPCGPHPLWSELKYDFFDAGMTQFVINSETYKTVVVDVELPGSRPIGKILSTLNDLMHVGRYLVKFMVTHDEAGYVWASIRKGRGISQLSLYRMEPEFVSGPVGYVFKFSSTGEKPCFPLEVSEHITFKTSLVQYPTPDPSALKVQLSLRLRTEFPTITTDVHDDLGIALMITSLVSDRRGRGRGSASWRAEMARCIYICLAFSKFRAGPTTIEHGLSIIGRNSESYTLEDEVYTFHLDDSPRGLYLRSRTLPWMFATAALE